jgi:hypothetical protein
MSQSDSLIGINDIEATELPDYRPLCVAAPIGLVLGLLSFLAFLHPVLWFVPLLAAGVNIYALISLAQSERMVGRQAAVAGLMLALAFGTAAPLRIVTYHWLARRDAGRFGREWIQAVLEQDVHKAHQMAKMPGERQPIDGQLAAFYEQSSELRTELETYLKTPVVATLMALGPQATVRHYQTESSQTDGRSDLVEDVYAVTYEENGRQKSFFIKLNLWRNLKKEVGPRLWRVQSPEGGYKPKNWA